MKLCKRCATEKPEEAFSKNKGSKDGLSFYCRECKKFYQKRYAKDGTERFVNSNLKSRAKRKREVTAKILDHLMTHPCVDCGESDPIVLEFDHVRGVKFKPISQMAGQGAGWRSVAEEIAKCEVRCANCHRRKTGKDQDWFMLQMIENRI